MKAIVLTCSSLEEYVRRAQENMGTDHPVFVLDKRYHVEPKDMRVQVLRALETLAAEYDTVLVSMGFCGGSWDQVCAPCRVVLPRVDDCVTLLLQTGESYCPNLKEPGHLYLYEKDPAESMLFRAADGTEAEHTPEWVDLIFSGYSRLDLIDTGYTDCYSEDYVAAAQDYADRTHLELDYVEGGIRLLEKLVSGQWDEQFLVAEPGHVIRHGDYFS